MDGEDPDMGGTEDYDRLGEALPPGDPIGGDVRVENVQPVANLTGAERAAINKARFEQMKSARNAAKAEVIIISPILMYCNFNLVLFCQAHNLSWPFMLNYVQQN